MKRILICGSNGLLGQRLALMLSSQTDYEVLNTSQERSFVFDDRLFDYTQLDIAKKGDVKSLISSFHPTAILNAAAATNVDWCEAHREEAWRVNVVGVENQDISIGMPVEVVFDDINDDISIPRFRRAGA